MPRFPDRRAILVPLVVALQAALVPWLAGTERVPAPPNFGKLPAAMGEFHLIQESPIEAEVAAQLGADRTLNRMYLGGAPPAAVNAFVAWFRTQRGGASQPHSPKVCLPGAGWTPESTTEIPLETAAGTIRVNRYVVAKGGERAVVLYWYQTPRRVIAGEWAAKFWLAADALRDKRTDTAMIRILTWGDGKTHGQADLAARSFAREFYPLLRAAGM